jgi:hypothetical protein
MLNKKNANISCNFGGDIYLAHLTIHEMEDKSQTSGSKKLLNARVVKGYHVSFVFTDGTTYARVYYGYKCKTDSFSHTKTECRYQPHLLQFHQVADKMAQKDGKFGGTFKGASTQVPAATSSSSSSTSSAATATAIPGALSSATVVPATAAIAETITTPGAPVIQAGSAPVSPVTFVSHRLVRSNSI